MSERVYRRVRDGALSSFAVHPGDGWDLLPEMESGELPPPSLPPSGEQWDGERYEYRVVNIGVIDTEARLVTALNELGSRGWKFVFAIDKASNWTAGAEKVFLVFMRPRPATGDRPAPATPPH